MFKRTGRKAVKITKNAQRLIDELIEAAGQSYWQDDQGSRPSEIESAKSDLQHAATAMHRYVANLQQQIRNNKGRK